MRVHPEVTRRGVIVREVPKQTASKSKPNIPNTKYVFKCVVCNMTFLTYRLGNKHKLREHPEVLRHGVIIRQQLTNAKSLKPSTVNLTAKFVFKCVICNITFSSYKQGLRHKQKDHPEVMQRGVIVRDVQKLLIKKLSNVKTSKPASEKEKPEAVTKEVVKHKPEQLRKMALIRNTQIINALIQCAKCKTCFMNMRSARNHTSCDALKVTQCEVCKITVSSYKKTQHRRLHQLGIHKYKILDLEYMLQNQHKILYCCKDCGIHFLSEASLGSHMLTANKRSHKCEQCKLVIGTQKGSNWHHVLSHLKEQLEAKDFIILHYVHNLEQSLKKKVKKSISTNPKLPITTDGRKFKKQMKRDPRSLLECHTCKKMMTRDHNQVMKGKCRAEKCIVCHQCGLTFTHKTYEIHKKVHLEFRKPLTMHDFLIRSTKDKRPVEMSVPKAMRRLPTCKCGVRAHKELLMCAWTAQCGINTVHCSICKLDFVRSTYDWHLKLHGTPQEKVNIKNLNQTYVYYRCDTCKLHFHKKSFAFKHKETCMKQKIYLCNVCGLTTSYYGLYNHVKIHKTGEKIKFNDLIILNASGYPVIKEPCKFPTCAKCNIGIIGYEDQHMKKCGRDEAQKHCPKCSMTFSEQAFGFHLPYYGCDDGAPSKKFKSENITPENSPKESEVTKLLSTYNKLEEAWTQLYQCEKCEVIVDSYDEVVRHCMEHRSASYEVAAFVCHVCDLNFDYSSFQRHKEQHFTRPGLNRARFEVMEFQPSMYNTPAWALYKEAFIGYNIQYKLKQSGPEQHTLYQCINCKIFCGGRVAAYAHAQQPKSCQDLCKQCPSCSLRIDVNSERAHKMEHEQSPDLTASSFRILWFCIETQALQQLQEKTEVEKKPKLSDRPVLYKCGDCNLHFIKKATAREHYFKHSTNISFRVALCQYCGLHFSNVSMINHYSLHHNKAKYKRGDFRIITIRDKPESPQTGSKNKIIVSSKKPQVNLYRCIGCDIHFLTEEIINQHIEYRKCRPDERIVCSHCNLGFRRASLSKHMSHHHDKLECSVLDFNIRDVMPKAPKRTYERKKTTLYKCSACSVHFVSDAALNNHFKEKSDFFREDCTKCNLAFGSALAINCHNICHRANQHLNTSDLHIVEKIRPDDKCVKPELQIYKCTACDVSFVSGITARGHINRHVPCDQSKIVKCECGLRFSPVSLLKHKLYHHSPRSGKYKVISMTPREGSDVTLKTEKTTKKKIISRVRTHMFQRFNPTKSNTLYKCTDCDISFLNYNTAKMHTKYSKHVAMTEKDLHRCEICNLFFTKFTLKKHIILHHRNGMTANLKIVNVRPVNVETVKEDGYVDFEFLDESKSSGENPSEGLNESDVLTANLKIVNVHPVIVEKVKEDAYVDFEFLDESKSSGENPSEGLNESDVLISDNGIKSKPIEIECPICDKKFKLEIQKKLHIAIDHAN